LVIISGPSGSGKSTILSELVERFDGRLRLAVSATTRPARPGEQNGVHYHFLSPDEFESRRQQGDFLECFEVFGRGHWYGTLHDEVRPSLEAGVWVILEVDVQGAAAALTEYSDAVTIFVRPSSLEELEHRLRGRKTETEQAIRRRLDVAQQELDQAQRYQHVVVNDTLPRAVEEISNILTERGLQ